MKYTYKNILIILLVIVIVVAIGWSLLAKPTVKIDNAIPVVENTTDTIKTVPISMCYYSSDKNDIGLYDTSWLKMEISGDKVTGEYRYLPAEKDSKVGTFEGTVGPLDQKIMGRRASVFWDTLAEGMSNKEELIIEFGDGSATAGYGEMVDRGDGVYLYKDKTNLFYPKAMPQIDCDSLNEKIAVETYIKDNIKTIATNKSVLGGTWYVVTIDVNQTNKSGNLTYEDGHIQSKAQFTYTYEKDSGKIIITKFTILKK